MRDQVPKAKPKGIAHGQARHIDAESLVHRKMSVKGSSGVSATVVITVQQGQVLMSIQPPFTWKVIMEPWKVEELTRTLTRTLTLAAEGAKRIAMRLQP